MSSRPFDLAGQRILVTGAASGIGAASARLLARLGAAVICADRAGAGALADEIGATAFTLDVRDRAAVEAAVRASEPLSGLVAAAAVFPPDDFDAPSFAATLDETLAVDLLGALWPARAALPGMRARRYGRIVLIGSLAGRTGGLIASAGYAAAKGGLHSLVRWLAQRAGPDQVTVNAVAPASIATPMMHGRPVDLGRIPLRRIGTAEEAAAAVAFLCAPEAGYVTGVILDVNGGVHMA